MITLAVSTRSDACVRMALLREWPRMEAEVLTREVDEVIASKVLGFDVPRNATSTIKLPAARLLLVRGTWRKMVTS